MFKKMYLPLCLLLAALLCVPAGAAPAAGDLRVYENGTLQFEAFTDGAEAAFDSDPATAFAGSITGKFAGRSVLTGITLQAGSKIRGLVVLGSEDGVNWVELYSRERVNTVCIFGYNGVTYDETGMNEMYTYAMEYLRIEIEYGSIADIQLRGYEVEVSGTIAELDADYGEGKGYDFSGSYYLDSADEVRTPYLFDHTIGSGSQGDAITKPVGSAQDAAAWIAVRTAVDRPLTAIALAHKSNDGNMLRWRGVRIEASADGETWDLLKVISADFDTVNDLTQKTLFILTVDPDNSYRYVRLSKTGSAISIGSMDLYVAADAVELPENLLNDWEGDPYLGPEAPEETDDAPEETDDPTQESTTAPTPAESTPGTAPSAETPQQSGCGSVLAGGTGAAAVCAAALGALAVAGRRRKTKRDTER